MKMLEFWMDLLYPCSWEDKIHSNPSLYHPPPFMTYASTKRHYSCLYVFSIIKFKTSTEFYLSSAVPPVLLWNNLLPDQMLPTATDYADVIFLLEVIVFLTVRTTLRFKVQPYSQRVITNFLCKNSIELSTMFLIWQKTLPASVIRGSLWVFEAEF